MVEYSAQIFISYAREDLLAVEALYRKLKAAGFTPWLDKKDIQPGQAWVYAIERAIEESDFVLVCLSRHSVERTGIMQKEIRSALQLMQGMPQSDIYLIPVRLERCKIPEPLSNFQFVDLFEPKGWSRLLLALKTGLERRREKSPEQVLVANSFSEIADVTDRLRGTLNLPTELPKGWDIAATFFNRASAHVGQYLSLQSDYRKGEALQNALQEVEALQRASVNTRGQFASRLSKVAEQWHSLLEAELDRFLARTKGTPEIPNPFVFGNPVAETELNVFTGRKDIVRKIEESILGSIHAPTLLLHGARRMGKTSILNQLPRLLGANFAPAVVDCQDPSVRGSAPSLLSFISKVIKDGLVRRHVIIDSLISPVLESEPYLAFDRWMGMVEDTLPSSMRVLLCLDEYESLESAVEKGWGEEFLDALRHLFQHRPRLVIMFTGAHTFAELGPVWTAHFISVRRIHVGFLNRDDVFLLLTQPIPRFGLKYTPKALNEIFAATNGQPFLTQAVAFELVQFLNEQRRRKATISDVNEAVSRVLTSGDSYFANVWSDAGEKGQAILRAMANDEPPPESPTALAWLKEHDVLNASGDFAVVMLKRWVQERVS
jgi:hypothetical protein